MRQIFKIVALLAIILSIPELLFASDNSYKQMYSVISFFEKIDMQDTYNVKDFFELFGRDNEAETELALRKNYPSLNLKANWFDNKDAKSYIDAIYETPEKYQSIFLSCIKSAEPTLFSKNKKRLFEFPPNVEKDFKIYNVMIGNRKIKFTFSQNDVMIENIYLPDGKSVYDIIPLCIK